jgi:acetyl esterase/lipase
MKKIIIGVVILAVLVTSGVFVYKKVKKTYAENSADSSIPKSPIAGQNQSSSKNSLNSSKEEYLNIEYDKIQGVDKNLLSLDIYNSSKQGQPKPVIIMVHGGGWSIGDKANNNVINPKKDYFAELGYIFISINYRLSPDYFFPDYPLDVAKAVNWIYQNISNYNGNPNHIFLMGHSAGAHLAALVGVDSRYGLDSSKLKGLILLDGAGYDIPLALETANTEIRTEMFKQAFGTDLVAQKQASPIYQIQLDKKIPKTLILFVQKRKDSQIQSGNLHQKISDSGNISEIYPILNTSHEDINTNLGKSDFEATQRVTKFLAED